MQRQFAKDADKYGVETIREFSEISTRINNARELLENHHNILPIFTFLENNTLTDVYYKSIDLKVDSSGDGSIVVSAEGVAPDLLDLSLQADAYGENPNIDDLVMSNITRSKEGLVIFDLDFKVKKRFLTNQTFIAQ